LADPPIHGRPSLPAQDQFNPVAIKWLLVDLFLEAHECANACRTASFLPFVPH
jgi:hypothetical protein